MGSRGAGGLPGRSPSNSWGSWRPSAARSCGDSREECGSTARPMGEPTGCPTGGPTGTHRMSHWSPIGCPRSPSEIPLDPLEAPSDVPPEPSGVPLELIGYPTEVQLEPPGGATGASGVPLESNWMPRWSPSVDPIRCSTGARWMSYWESTGCLTGGPPGVQLDIPLEPTADPIRCSTGAHWRSHWRPLEAPLDDVPSEASGGAIR